MAAVSVPTFTTGLSLTGNTNHAIDPGGVPLCGVRHVYALQKFSFSFDATSPYACKRCVRRMAVILDQIARLVAE